MKIIDKKTTFLITAGYHQAVIMPVMGCGLGVGVTYIRNPNATYEDYGRNCFKGAVHGMNPGFNIIGRAVPGLYGRYAAGFLYSAGCSDFVDYVTMPQKSNTDTCRFYPTNVEPIAFGGE